MTATLPRALAPWAKELALFPEEIAVPLAGLAARLAGVLGGGDGAVSPEGEPDGYSGLARRGSYERLLATEWLLHDELPDEFLRRVVANEHSFLDRAYERAPAIRQTVVLFDAGIDQLGAPRLVQLAALVVLARRADRSKSQVAWGVLQDEARTLQEGLTVASVTAFVGARGLLRPKPEDITSWLAALAETPMSELWLVGPRSLHGAASTDGISLLALSELLDPEAPARVLAEAHSAKKGTPIRSAILELPHPRIAIQTLRDPFATSFAAREATRTALDTTSTVAFGTDGRRLYVRGEGGTLITVQIPNSPRAKVGPPAAWKPPRGERIVAVGQGTSKRTVVVTETADAVFMHSLSKRGMTTGRTMRFAVPSDYTPPAIPALRPLGILGEAHACYVDAEGTLVELHVKDGAPSLTVNDDGNAVRSTSLKDGFAYVRTRSSLQVVIAKETVGLMTTDLHSLGVEESQLEDTEVFFGPVIPPPQSVVTCVRRAGTAVIVRTNRSATIACPDGHSVVGTVEVMREQGQPPLLTLVTIDSTRTRLEMRDVRQTEMVASSSSPIAYACASDHSCHLVFLTHAGELGIYSYLLKTLVYRVTPGAPGGPA